MHYLVNRLTIVQWLLVLALFVGCWSKSHEQPARQCVFVAEGDDLRVAHAIAVHLREVWGDVTFAMPSGSDKLEDSEVERILRTFKIENELTGADFKPLAILDSPVSVPNAASEVLLWAPWYITPQLAIAIVNVSNSQIGNVKSAVLVSRKEQEWEVAQVVTLEFE